MKLTIETLTPADAKDLLAANVNNRVLRPDRIAQYAQDMANGDWTLTGEPLIFARDGQLLNGQHRLHACIQAEAPFTTAVARDADPAVFQHVDSGLKRTHGDITAQLGVKGAHLTAAAARFVLGYHAGAITGSGRDLTMAAPRRRIVREIADNVELYEKAVRVAKAGARMGHNPTGLAAFGVLTAQINGEGSADEFVTGLLSGEGMEARDPRLALQRLLLGPYRPKTGGPYLAVVIRAYQAWLSGEERKALQTWKNGPFPQIPVLDKKKARR